MTDMTIPRETSEWMEVPVYTDDGEAVTNYEVAVTRWPARPTAWSAPTLVGESAGVVLSGLEQGTHQVWVRVSGTVIAAGSFWVD